MTQVINAQHVQVRNQPWMYLINLPGLVERINHHLAPEVSDVSLGEFEEKTPKRNPFIYRLERRELGKRGKFPLIQERVGALAGLLGIESDHNLGYIFVETGEEGISESDDGARYETIRLRIKQPLELRGGRVVPNCSVKLCRTSYEMCNPYTERKDHVRRAGLIWKSTDLTKVLPNEWFDYK